MANDGDGDDFKVLFQNISEQLVNLGLHGATDFVPIFDGELSKFQNWVKAIEKCALVNNLPDQKKKLVAYRFSSGTVSDFILRNIQESPHAEWAQLKTALADRFSVVSDAHIHFSRLRNIRQNKLESIQDFAERILVLAQDAYAGFDQSQRLVNHQTVGFFVDGLADESIRQKLTRENPTSFQDAVTSAINEFNIRIRYKLRSHEIRQTFEPRQNNEKHENLNSEQPMEVEAIRRYDNCTFCNRRGHVSSNCRKRLGHVNAIKTELRGQQFRNDRQLPYRGPDWGLGQNYEKRGDFRPPIRCFFCGKLGHRRSDCRQYLQLRTNSDNGYHNQKNY